MSGALLAGTGLATALTVANQGYKLYRTVTPYIDTFSTALKNQEEMGNQSKSKKRSASSMVTSDKRAKLTIDREVARVLKAKRLFSPEEKQLDYTIASSITTTQTFHLINGMVQGDTDSTRTGSAVRISKIKLSYSITGSTSMTGGSDMGFVTLFCSQDPNGIAPAGIFAATGSSAIAPMMSFSGSYPELVLENHDQRKSFKVHHLNKFKLNDQYSTQSLAGPIVTKTFNINKVVQFNNGNAGTIADFVHNAYYIGWVGSQAAGANATAIDVYAQIFFTDM